MSHKRIRSVGLKGFTRALVHGMTVLLSVAAMANARSASAAPIYVNVDPDQVLQDSNFIWDVDGDGEKDLILSQTFGCVGDCLTTAHASALSGGIVMATATDVAPLSAGAIIGPASLFGGMGLMARIRSPTIRRRPPAKKDSGTMASRPFSAFRSRTRPARTTDGHA